MNHKKLYRIYREERLVVRKRGGRKRALGTRAPATVPQGKNQRWSLDFVSDALADGRRFRVLAIVDDFTRECLALVADTSLSGHRVARELDAVIARAAGRRRWSATMARSSPRRRSCAGSRRAASPGTTSSRASRSRTRSWSPSTAAARRAVERDHFRSLAHVRELLAEWQDDFNQTPAHEPQGAHTERVCKPVHPGP